MLIVLFVYLFLENYPNYVKNMFSYPVCKL